MCKALVKGEALHKCKGLFLLLEIESSCHLSKSQNNSVFAYDFHVFK